jgi:hypothetical protein
MYGEKISTPSKASALGGAALVIADRALTISGFQSRAVAILLWTVAFVLFLPLLNEYRKRAGEIGKRLRAEYGKSSRIWSMIIVILIGAGIGAILGGTLAGLGWWMAKPALAEGVSDRLKIRDTENGPILSVKPPPQSAVLMADIGTPVTPAPTPTPPLRHVNIFTPQEILTQLEKAGPLERNQVAEGFINGVVDWTLWFKEIQDVRTDTMTVQFRPEINGFPMIVCPKVRLEGNKYLGRIEHPVPFRVKGVISEAAHLRIVLTEVSFEQLPNPASTQKPTPTPAEELKTDSKDPSSPQTKNLGPRELFALIEGRTPLQAAKLIEPYKGLWTELEGEMIHSPLPQGGGCVTTIPVEGKGVQCRFAQKWCEELDGLKDRSVIKVRGKIEAQFGDTLALVECELL